jgi:hypothetical protein
MHLTYKTMAHVFTLTQGRDDEHRVHNQLRGQAISSLLTASDALGPKGALRFDRQEIAAARTLLTALDLGITGETLKHVNSYMRAEGNGGRCLRSAVQSAEKSWVLEVVLFRGKSGALEATPRWLVDGDRGHAADPLDISTIFLGPVEAVIQIPFTAICDPVFDRIAQMDSEI